MSSEKTTKDKNGWLLAQAEVKRKIAFGENRLRTLKRSLALIQEKIRDGEPWPSQNAAQIVRHE